MSCWWCSTSALRMAFYYVKKYSIIWIQPAAGDAGGALGAALSTLYLHHGKERVVSKERDAMKGAYLGPEFTDTEIQAELTACGAVFKKLSENDMIEEVVSALVDEKAVCWMQGRMEFGPRALGGRISLLTHVHQ